MNHFPHDWTRADDGYLHDDVIKTFWLQTRKAGHLGAAFDLKHSYGVGFLQCLVNRLIVRGQMPQVHFGVVIISNEL